MLPLKWFRKKIHLRVTEEAIADAAEQPVRLSELQNTDGKPRAKLTCTEGKYTDPKLCKTPTLFIQSIKKTRPR